jgi:ribosomal protein L3
MARNQAWNIAGFGVSLAGVFAFGLGAVETYDAAERARNRTDQSVGTAVMHFIGDQKDIISYTWGPVDGAINSIISKDPASTIRPMTSLGELTKATDMQLLLVLGSIAGAAGSIVALRK